MRSIFECLVKSSFLHLRKSQTLISVTQGIPPLRFTYLSYSQRVKVHVSSSFQSRPCGVPYISKSFPLESTEWFKECYIQRACILCPATHIGRVVDIARINSISSILRLSQLVLTCVSQSGTSNRNTKPDILFYKYRDLIFLIYTSSDTRERVRQSFTHKHPQKNSPAKSAHAYTISLAGIIPHRVYTYTSVPSDVSLPSQNSSSPTDFCF